MKTNGEITLSDVLKEMRAGFQRVDQRFNELETQMDERFKQVDKRFEQVDKRFDEMLKNLGRYHRDHEQRIVALEKAKK